MSAIDTIKLIEAEIRERHDRIRAIRDACEHDWQPSNPEWVGASSPLCAKCDARKDGWWCETSPTKTCDYRHPDGRYNFDSCRHCGDPEERK